jgi:hypothetical protein
MTQNPINNAASDLTIDNLFLDGNTISSTDTNGNVIIAPDGSGEVSVTAAPIVPSTDRADSLGSATNSWDNVYADGITFNDGTDILGTYIGRTSWTPGISFGGGTTGITYAAQTGSYTRIGNLAFCTAAFTLSNKGSSTGNALMTGFPLTFRTGSINQAICVGNWNAFTFNANHSQLLINCLAGSSTIRLFTCGNNVAFISSTDAMYANNSVVSVNFVVEVD